MNRVRIRKNSLNRKEWGCPLTRNRSPWCFQICEPKDGNGQCGRVAPHALIGRTQAAILSHKASQGA